jgi:5-methylthioadenosine/S-adenosylhomocysteine deaminase
MLADELQVPIHMHVHETRDEIQMGMENHDKRPIARLNEHGLLSPALMAVHMTQLNDEEIDLFAQTGSHVVHCPQSNLKLASGFCPVSTLVDKHINVCLGTDSAASNNNLDMLSEMQTAALLAKGVAETATALPAIEALKMATINGAKALGIDAVTGSLAPGKSADLVAIDMNRLGTQPVYHPVSQVVYSCQSGDISDVWITGKRVLHDQQLTQVDEQLVLEKCLYWNRKIFS